MLPPLDTADVHAVLVAQLRRVGAYIDASSDLDAINGLLSQIDRLKAFASAYVDKRKPEMEAESKKAA